MGERGVRRARPPSRPRRPAGAPSSTSNASHEHRRRCRRAPSASRAARPPGQPLEADLPAPGRRDARPRAAARGRVSDHDACRRPCPGSRSRSGARRGRPACRGAATARCAAGGRARRTGRRSSVRRRSKASASAGQRIASSRFQNGSGSVGSCSRIASPRSRSSRPGMAWTRASWTSSRRIVAGSTASSRRSRTRACVPMPERYRRAKPSRRRRRIARGRTVSASPPRRSRPCPAAILDPRGLSAFMTPRPGRLRSGSAASGPEHRRERRAGRVAPAAGSRLRGDDRPRVTSRCRSRTSRSTRPRSPPRSARSIAFTNDGAAPHTATLDDGSCTTPNIDAGRPTASRSAPPGPTRSTARSTPR